MRKLACCLMAAALLLPVASAQAVLIDLKTAAEPGPGLPGEIHYGESAYTSLNLFADFGIAVRISATSASAAHPLVYLDSGNAGMGVCPKVFTTAPVGSATNGTKNLCDPSDDDNVKYGERLRFDFDEAVVISKIWFNNNHDDDWSLIGDSISILLDGPHMFSGVVSDPGHPRDGDVVYESPMYFAKGDFAYITFYDPSCASNSGTQPCGDEFYLSAMEINRVPEPATLALLGVALAGLGLTGRRKRAL